MIFESFIDSLNLPENNAVILDNATIHKKLTLTNPTNLIYVPPYSPQYNAIELCFSQVKREFRKMFVMNKDLIEHDIIKSIDRGLNSSKIQHSFDHVDKLIMI